MANNAAQLEAEARRAVDDMLKNDISVFTEAILKQHIWNDIYWAYVPKQGGWTLAGSRGNGQREADGTYKRRYSLPRSVYSALVESGVLMTTSKAKRRPSVKGNHPQTGVPGEFLLLLEGDSGKYNGGMGIWQGGFPRPAVSRAQEEINQTMPAVIRKYLKERIG